LEAPSGLLSRASAEGARKAPVGGLPLDSPASVTKLSADKKVPFVFKKLRAASLPRHHSGCAGNASRLVDPDFSKTKVTFLSTESSFTFLGTSFGIFVSWLALINKFSGYATSQQSVLLAPLPLASPGVYPLILITYVEPGSTNC